ncbi:MAG: hypothetical protein ACFFCW_27045 [Candidatus Hodarchaeota archaeon]
MSELYLFLNISVDHHKPTGDRSSVRYECFSDHRIARISEGGWLRSHDRCSQAFSIGRDQGWLFEGKAVDYDVPLGPEKEGRKSRRLQLLGFPSGGGCNA